jgi:hypothetical protein
MTHFNGQPPSTIHMSFFRFAAHLLLFETHGSASALVTKIKSVEFVFQPSPPPRFDTFSDKLLGEWQWWTTTSCNDDMQVSENDDIDNKKKFLNRGNVQEVMRRCGGAVQGIREVSGLVHGKNTNFDKEGFYLNRSNDGFVFFDQDASYSCGPILCSHEEATNSKCITSLGMGKSRLCVITTALFSRFDGDGGTATSSSDYCYQLVRKTKTTTNQIEFRVTS